MIGGPYGAPVPGDSPTPPQGVRLPPKDSAAEEPCARKILSTLATRAYRRPVTDEDVQTLMGFYKAGRADDELRCGHPARTGADSRRAELPVPRRARAGGQATGTRVSPQRSGSRIAAVVLPVEQHAGRRAAERGGSRQAEGSGVARAAGAAHAARSPLEGAGGQLRQPVARAEQACGRRCPTPSCTRSSTRTCATRWSRRRSCSSRSQIAATTAASSELLTANYSFLNERLATHYGIPNVYGNHFRRVTFADGVRGGLLGQASILTVTSYPQPHVGRDARPMAAREPARRAAAAAAARRAGAEGSGRGRRAAIASRADGGAPEESRVRVVPSADGSARVCAGEFRRRSASGAPSSDGERDRRVRVVARRHAVRRRARAARAPGEPPGRLRADASREKLLAYAIGRGLEYYDQPAVRKIARDAARHDYRWSSIISGIVNSTPFSMSTAREAGESRSAKSRS